MNHSENQPQKTFTDFLRKVFKGVLEPIAQFLTNLGIKPSMVTAFGLIGNLAAGLVIAFGYLFWGGLIAVIIWPLDALDGTMARLRNESSSYGAFVDSVTDRYSEIAIFAGLLIYFVIQGSIQDVLLVFFAFTGGIMVSYVRAKAESLNYSVKIGILTRAERYIVLMPGLLLGYPRISLWILAILANFTAIQRFWYVRKMAKGKQENWNIEKEV